MSAHVDNPFAKKLTPWKKRQLFQEQCRQVPCAEMLKNPPCVVCVHEGLIRKHMEGKKP